MSFLPDSLWLVVAVALLVVAIVKRTVGAILLAIIAGLLIGVWRGESAHRNMMSYQKFIGQTVQVQGTISSDVKHKGSESELELSNVQINKHELSGEVWVGAITKLPLQRDDRVTASDKLAPGFGTFGASMSFAHLENVGRSGGDPLQNIRDGFAAGLRKAVPEPEETLGLGYLTGQHNDLPEQLTKQLQMVGLIHIVIAGGYNVTILVRFARRRLAKISKYLAALISSSILFGLTLMAGFSAPMARTFVVTELSLLAWYYGRKLHPLVLLPFSAAITAVVNPNFVWGNVGWYMTFVAYGGLIVLGPMLKNVWWRGREQGALKQILVDTISVQMVTFPLMAFAFGQYSVYGLPANLLVLPLMPLTMLATALAGLSGTFLPIPLAHVAGWPAAQLLGYTDKVTTWLATAPGSGAGATFSPAELAIAYAAILFVIFVLWRKTHYDFRTENVVE